MLIEVPAVVQTAVMLAFFGNAGAPEGVKQEALVFLAGATNRMISHWVLFLGQTVSKI